MIEPTRWVTYEYCAISIEQRHDDSALLSVAECATDVLVKTTGEPLVCK